MKLAWQTVVATTVTLLVIILAGQVLFRSLHEFIDANILHEAVAALFLGVPGLSQVAEGWFSKISLQRRPDFGIQFSWFSAGVGGGCMIVAINQLMAGLAAMAIGTAAALSHTLNHLPPLTVLEFRAIFTFVMNSGVLWPFAFLVFVYVGERMYARTRSWSALSFLLAIILSAGLEVLLQAFIWQASTDDIIRIAGRAVLFGCMALPIGAVVGRLRQARAVSRVAILLRKLPPEKQWDIYVELLGLVRGSKLTPV